MSSPFEKTAADLNHEAALPVDNWLARRFDSIRSHEKNIETVINTIDKMGHVLLEGRVSTDLRMHQTSNDVRSVDPRNRLAEMYYTIIPALATSEKVMTDQFHTGWQPETAMSIQVALRDQYDYSDKKTRAPRPTGDVKLSVYIRTWGKLSDDETDAINDLPGTWTECTDNGWSRNGTQVVATRKPGEVLTENELETILAPLARHIIDYRDIAQVSDVVLKSERRGNFSTSNRLASRAAPERHWRGHTSTTSVELPRVLASKSIHDLLQLP